MSRAEFQAGFTLVELLIAMALTLTIVGTVLAVVVPAQRAFAVQPEAADVQQRVRVAVERLSRAVRTAGLRTPITHGVMDVLLAPVLPYRIGAAASDAAAGVYFRPGVLSLVSLRLDPATGLAVRVSRTYFLRTTGPDASHLMEYDGEAATFPVLDHVVGLGFELLGDPLPPVLIVDPSGEAAPRASYGPHPPPVGRDDPADDWGVGENCGWAVVDGAHRSRLAVLSEKPELVPLSAGAVIDGPWCPSAADPDRFDADLLRVRTVRVRVRIQAGRAFRGARGPLFVNPGTATANRYVPDEEVQLDVSPRSLTSAY
jgi:hypothetical protein